MHNCTYPNEGSKNVRFSSKEQSARSTTTPAQKAKSTKPILKSTLKMTTDNQQSVSMISERYRFIDQYRT